MKKLIFGLIAVVFFGLSVNAQQKLSEPVKNVVNYQMLALVEYAKSTGAAKMSLPDWVKSTGETVENKEHQILLEKVYSYVKNQTSSCEILKNDNTILYTVTMSNNFDVADNNTSKVRCGLRCILQAIHDVIEIIIELLEP